MKLTEVIPLIIGALLLIIFKALESGTSVELTLITSRTSSTDTLATADSGPKHNEKEAEFKEFWRKN
jgi:hypothetical protein